MSEENYPIRIAVYNGSGEFMGYKADSVWSLSEEHWKEHSSDEEPTLIKRLSQISNRSQAAREELVDEGRRIIIEPVNSNSTREKIIYELFLQEQECKFRRVA